MPDTSQGHTAGRKVGRRLIRGSETRGVDNAFHEESPSGSQSPQAGHVDTARRI